MRFARTTTHVMTLGFVGALALAATSVSGAETASIEQALESAAIGQWFSVEGVVVSHSDERVFYIRDDTGEMPVVIPDDITRKQGVPALNERIRVSGKFDSKKLDASVMGMRVQFMERLGEAVGGRGAPPTDPSMTSARPSTTPPAALVDDASGTTARMPVLEPQLVNQMRLLRREYEAARRDAEESAALYARSAYVAGKDGAADPAAVRQLEAAEARVKEIQAEVPALSRAAREAGLEEQLIDMFEQSMGVH